MAAGCLPVARLAAQSGPVMRAWAKMLMLSSSLILTKHNNGLTQMCRIARVPQTSCRMLTPALRGRQMRQRQRWCWDGSNRG